MLGYHDAQREWLGKGAARLDDLVNLIPSRLTAGLMLLVGFVQGRASKQALQVWWHDCRATASPNAGHPMSAAAGLLGVELDKVGHYQLGRGQRFPGTTDIGRASHLMWGTCLATLAMSSVIVLALK
jgi:adenosylcobinamide-phosphate synthase